MRVLVKNYFVLALALLVTSCAWYKGPALQANANGSLDGSSLNETSGPGFISTLKSADNYGSSDTGFADNGGNYEVSGFENS
ncbi:hypothetical protein IB633_04115 [Francisella philomiragia]|uniref:Lipoprotein n=1 Tax=Francisella philomiragia subsp. philomiragia (strain ATCC 25017 / CCUG 19701 / FSC 153 / O\|nr:hypothetical protein [Francisella philomiragia]AJI47998.1 hypothetical protein BF30_661 [Francisella philomiragia]AJI49077.1 hypothetical protein KU46_893 [Francisella philomiragia]MBK2021023.1 hypothetical protein [Francisella philomiragia]MBK2030272.1 hypothetical protein [Francisella philomiragia]MBK2264522.1 hypothetical protein [Francisella philomiragia]